MNKKTEDWEFNIDLTLPSNTQPSQMIGGTWRPGDPDLSPAQQLRQAHALESLRQPTKRKKRL